jgi:hypothetical protein
MSKYDLVDHSAHQRDTTTVFKRRGTELGRVSDPFKVESWPRIANHKTERGSVSVDTTMNALACIITAAVESGIREGLLQRNKEVHFIGFVQAIAACKLHDLVTRGGNRF